MVGNSPSDSSELRSAFREYERQVRIRNSKIGSILAFIFVPAGASLDYFVLRNEGELLVHFLELRFLCSFLLAIVWALLHSNLGLKIYQFLGLLVALLPVSLISWMIYETTGANSTYYAGLNLAMLGTAIVLRWTLFDSVLVFVFSLATYLAACLLNSTPRDPGLFFNNFYFLFVTGVFIVTGSWFYNRIRFSEFELRYQLDHNQRMLEESNRKLMELDQVKSRFFANISHELRTPLTLLLAPLETLLHRYHRAFDEETRDLLETMHANGMRLLKLINDLLDLVRLESGKMEVKHEPLEVDEFVKGLASAARQVADDKRIRLETSVDAGLGTVLADRDKLEKILLNLLFNALKFTPAGGQVDMRAEKSPDEIILSVKDTGMGIAAQNLPFVFDRFWQADGSSKRKYQGVGIGLALVKELAEIQGGNVSVESQEGKGTKFTVRLPYARAEAVPGTSTTAGADGDKELMTIAANGSGTVSSEEWLTNLYRRAELFPSMTPLQEAMRPVETTRSGNLPLVLVADDEPDMLRFLKSQLSKNFQVLEAVDGQQAIEKASQFLPDIILLDMMMPERDGLQACREIRERTPTQSIPIILLTARADEETKLAALSAGASDFLAKPFSTTELHVRIKNLVESFHYQRKLAKQNQILESTIEQLKETESQLVQTEKLVSLGRMSAGIIHEINNPLNFAATGLYTLRKKGKLLGAEQQAEFTEVLQDVEEGFKRVKDIVSDLITFTHPDNEQVENVEVADVIASAMRFLSNEIKDRVRVELNLPELQSVQANNNRLTQVFVNLLQNSVDGLEEKSFDGEQPTIWIDGRVDSEKSTVIVRDNGQGIEPQNLGKIFDPFFTTKEVGKGMGLGLSICYRIMQEYEGQIRVKSERGKFCEFTLEFLAKPAQ